MPVKSSGQLSFTDLATEFPDTAPFSIADYYRGGGLVPDAPVNSQVPVAGPIRFSNFYGATYILYAFGTIPTSLNEGVSGVFNVSTVGIANGTTLYWTINLAGNLNSSDFSATSGSFVINTNAGNFSITTIADELTEGAETFTVSVRTGSTIGPVVATSNSVTINDTSLTRTYAFGTIPTNINEGGSATFNVTTTNVPNGTTLYWTILNNTTTNADFSATSGSFTINSNAGSFTVTPTADQLTEGAESFRVEVRTGSTSGTVRVTSNSVTVNDTSLTRTYAFGTIPTSINEGSSGTFNVTTTNVPNSTTLYWTILNNTTTNADFSATSGSFTINSNAGSFTISPRADTTTEGAETFRVEVRTDSTSGTVRVTSNLVTVNDTSLNPSTYSIGSTNIARIIEGYNAFFTVFTTGVASGTTLYWNIEGVSGPAPNLVSTALLNGSAGILPQETHFLEIFNSRRLGDIDNNGTLSSFDTLQHMRWAYDTTGSAIPSDQSTYIVDTLYPRLRSDATKYSYVYGPAASTADFLFSQGSFAIGTNGQGGITISPMHEAATGENDETFRIRLFTDAARTNLVATSHTIAIVEPTYSVTVPASINEGTAGTFTVNTAGVSNSTILYWTILNVTTTNADFSATSGNFTINSNTGSFTVTPTADAATEGSETFQVQIRTTSTSGTIRATSSSVTINDTSRTPAATYNFGTIPTSINEGSSGTFNFTTAGVPNGTTLYWTINLSGNLNSSDFSATSGSFTINSNAGSFSITTIADQLTEGAESFTVSVRTGSFSGPVVRTSNSVTINDTSLTRTYAFGTIPTSINEGSSGTFNVTTTNVPNGTILYWTINLAGNLNSSDFSSTSGSFTINSNAGSFSISTIADQLTEGAESFTVSIRTGSISGPAVRTSNSVTINDTSLTRTYAFGTIPTSINEGSSGTFNVTTTGVPNATTLYWIILHSTTAGADFITASGTFIINSNRGSFVVSPTADAITEGAQTFRVEVRTDSFSGTVRATSGLVTVNDTSTSPTYNFGTIPASINEGSSGTFNVTTTGVPNGTTLYWAINLTAVVTSGDFPATSGSFTINSNAGSFVVSPRADVSTEGAETFTVSIRTGSISGTVVRTSNSVTINDTSLTAPGQVSRTTAGTTTWVCPTGVTSVSVLCIGAGGGGKYNGGGAGAGGNLAYRNNMTVTPGVTYYLRAGTGGLGSASGTGDAGVGGTSWFNTSSTSAGTMIFAGGGDGGKGTSGFSAPYTALRQGGLPSTATPPTASNVTTHRGGQGGNGSTSRGAGGGGAGGYTGTGGRGAGTNGNATGGNNGGGGGGYSGNDRGGLGGGTRIFGSGASGSGGSNVTTGIGGNGGDGGTGTTTAYGKGGPADTGSATSTALNGTNGAVRILWPGITRSWPSTGIADQ